VRPGTGIAFKRLDYCLDHHDESQIMYEVHEQLITIIGTCIGVDGVLCEQTQSLDVKSSADFKRKTFISRMIDRLANRLYSAGHFALLSSIQRFLQVSLTLLLVLSYISLCIRFPTGCWNVH
jgi:hypothetical protein